MITVLAGGVGAARFLRGLVQVVAPDEVTAVVNVGDDLRVHGLHVSPDLDSIVYHLAGVVHPDQQWGRADESFVVAGELERLGRPTWFTLGDRDLGVHVHRTARLAEGAPLSQVTAEVAHAFGVTVRLLPATDDRVTTRVHTAAGDDLHFQEYWVRDHGDPEVAAVTLTGRDRARPAPGVVEALVDADVVLVAPSNPVVSIGTILAVPGIAEAVRTTPAPVVGVSPIVGDAVVRGMADRLLPAIGVPTTAAGVAHHYADWLDGWVLDDRDAAQADAVAAAGVRPTVTDTMMDDPAVAAALARTCLDLAAELSHG
jgi:LPPG:FO 2-phospho-L-lactate transferase